MADTPWTPGPWRLDEERYDELYGPIVDAEGYVGHSASGAGLAVLDSPGIYVSQEEQDIAAANHRLIAAAPDLADALESVTSALESTEEYSTSHGTHFVAVEARKLLTRLRTK